MENQTFYCTYGDGLFDIDLNRVLDSHHKNGKIATLFSSRPTPRFGASSAVGMASLPMNAFVEIDLTVEVK